MSAISSSKDKRLRRYLRKLAAVLCARVLSRCVLSQGHDRGRCHSGETGCMERGGSPMHTCSLNVHE